MKFRPCIDIHNGQVKQIVGGSLLDRGNEAEENFVSQQDATFYAKLYKSYGLRGGHIILLNSEHSEFYKKTKAQALAALRAYPQGLQVGGGITTKNAWEFLEAGATHVIVTSYIFKDGQIHKDRLEEMTKTVSKERLVIDLSCRKKGDHYYVVTDRWQNFTDQVLNLDLLEDLSDFCDEFLIHAVDVEGKASGVDKDLVRLLGTFHKAPITYAGGVGTFEDLQKFKRLTNGATDITVGSALSIFGGPMEFKEILELCDNSEE